MGLFLSVEFQTAEGPPLISACNTENEDANVSTKESHPVLSPATGISRFMGLTSLQLC